MSAATEAPGGRSAASRAVRDPRLVAAALAVAVRAAVAMQTGSQRAPSLDGAYFLDWAGDIASGDVLGRSGTISGEAFLFNPLYAYVIAPLVGLAGKSSAAIVVLQALLAGATAALTAAAARRLAGLPAAWVAGVAVAFSAALVHLDGKVAVSGLAAFLVAGAVWSLSPEEDDAALRRGHGPLASGVWLGLSMLARPVVLPAVLAAAWLHARRSARPWRAAALVAIPAAACAALPFARNLAVAGEPVVFTAANGLNLHLGNNPAARRAQAMATDEFRFGPLAMHEDAPYRVAYETHREPARGEVSAWFTRRALSDFAAAPGDSLGWYWTKLRWFAGPAEQGSSDELDADRAAAPSLWLAFVPTWLLAAFAAASLVAKPRRAEVLLGPGAVVAAHALACTLVFPLSHYRSPCIPALAVMTGVAAAALVAAGRARSGRSACVVFAVAIGVAVLGWVPPRPPSYPEARLADEAVAALARDDVSAADDLASRSLATSPDDVQALTVRLIVANRQGRFDDARAAAARLATLRPWDPDALIDVAWSDFRLGRKAEALRDADGVVALYPWSAKVRSGRGAMRAASGDIEGARDDLRFALSRGFRPPAWALERAGL